jgi:hypothetical protein
MFVASDLGAADALHARVVARAAAEVKKAVRAISASLAS